MLLNNLYFCVRLQIYKMISTFGIVLFLLIFGMAFWLLLFLLGFIVPFWITIDIFERLRPKRILEDKE